MSKLERIKQIFTTTLLASVLGCSQSSIPISPIVPADVIRNETNAGMKNKLDYESMFFLDSDQTIDEFRFYLMGYQDGPFPKSPETPEECERLTDILLKKYSKLDVSYRSIEIYYMRVVVLENYFKYHQRSQKYLKADTNQDIILQSCSGSSHVLQYLLYKMFATFKSNRYEVYPIMRSDQLRADHVARAAMNQHLKHLCEKHGYTLTAFFWSGEEAAFRSEKAKKQGTEALRFYLSNKSFSTR